MHKAALDEAKTDDRATEESGLSWRSGLQFIQALWSQLGQDKVVIRASGLAYVTLLAVVPLIAVMLALFSAFAAFQSLRSRVENLLFSQFLPTRQDEIINYINQFTENTSRLGIWGVVFLVVTAIMLLDNIESNFNDIWHVSSRRSFVAKITAYTSVLVFGTLLLGASLSISASLKAMLFSGNLIDLSMVSRVSTWAFPMILTMLAFLLMYLIIPFTRVHFKSALFGALIAGTAWEAVKNLFANTIGQSVQYSTIYGSIAVVPIFLVWIYVTWIIVLTGLEIAYTHQHLKGLVRRRRYRRTGGRAQLALALRVFGCAADRFHRGEEPASTDDVAEHFRVPLEAIEIHIGRLVEAGLLRRIACGGGEGVIPATSLDRITMSNLIRASFDGGGDLLPDAEAIEREVESVLSEFEGAGYGAVSDLTVRDVVEGACREKPNDPASPPSRPDPTLELPVDGQDS